MLQKAPPASPRIGLKTNEPPHCLSASFARHLSRTEVSESSTNSVSTKLRFDVSWGGKVTFEEKDGFEYATVTVQLPGGERVPFLFTIKQLVASSMTDSFGGELLVSSYRGSSFLDPKGRGGS